MISPVHFGSLQSRGRDSLSHRMNTTRIHQSGHMCQDKPPHCTQWRSQHLSLCTVQVLSRWRPGNPSLPRHSPYSHQRRTLSKSPRQSRGRCRSNGWRRCSQRDSAKIDWYFLLFLYQFSVTRRFMNNFSKSVEYLVSLVLERIFHLTIEKTLSRTTGRAHFQK